MSHPRTEESRGPLSASQLIDRGRASRAAGRPDDAIAQFRDAAALDPTSAEAHHQLGNALKALRRYAEAEASLARAQELAPADAAVALNWGVALLELGRGSEAVECFRKAVALEPGRPEAHNVLGHALLTLGRCAEAARSLEEAMRLRPGYAAANDNLGRVLKAQGRADEAIARHRSAVAADPRPETQSNLLYSLNFPSGIPADTLWAEHRKWGEACEAANREGLPGAPERLPVRSKLRIGYVSPDFVGHAVSFFIEPVLEAHDRSQFEVTCYSDAPVADAVTARLKALAGRWRDTAGWDHGRFCSAVREDGIDILVDLAGHTARNRLPAFARRPAPVQATWLGYPNTTGLKAVDYRITEAVSDPPGRSEAWHSEALVRLPGVFLCYRPPEASPPVNEPPIAGGGGPTFGCFNNLAKVNPAAIELWSRILRGAPGSRLILKSLGLADPETAEAIRAQFSDQGIDPGRITCDGRMRSTAQHLALYHGVDVALDTFPYNGTTTTCEALWMGVPVVTLAGQTHRERVGASLLGALGASEWVASTSDEYVAAALALAADPEGLARKRCGLRERMRASRLCDAAGFTRHLEAAYRDMWRRKGGEIAAA